MNVLFINNIPSPYRVDFFNELGKYCYLTVAFGRRTASDRDKAWRSDRYYNFEAVFVEGIEVGTDASISFRIISVIRQGFDIILLGGYSSPMYAIAMEYMKRKKIPFLLNADGGFIKRDRKLVYMVKRHLIGMASAWMSTGKLTDQYLLYYGARKDRIFRYPFSSVKDSECCLPQGAERFQKKQELRIPEKRIIIAVGQFIPRKGLDLLMRCVSGIKEDTGIYMIGGEPGEEYKKLLDEVGEDRVHFVGFRKKEELRDYYIAADIFVFPTREDIWGLVLNEAMANGLPCVASDRAIAACELIEDGKNGYLVDPEDIDLMTDRLNQLLENQEKRIRMGSQAYEKSRGYTIEEMAKRHMEVFKMILAKRQEQKKRE